MTPVLRCLILTPLLVVAAARGADAATIDPTHALHQAEAALSERYAALWGRLAPAERLAFAERERRWLAAERWTEKDACTAVRGQQAGLACTIEVTLRHVRELDAATRPATAAYVR